MSKSLLKRLHSNYNVRVTCFLILVIKGCMLSKENKVLKQWWVNEWQKSSILCKLFHFILLLIILYNYHKSFREYNSCPGRKVLFCSFAQFCLNLWPHGLWTVAHLASLCFIISWNLLKLMSIESVIPYKHLILWLPLFFLLSIFPSVRVFSNELALRIRWPKYLSFRFSISPSNEYSVLAKIIST